jgi:hypothetical protein
MALEAPHVGRRDTRPLNYPLLLAGLMGTCREVLTTIELPSGQVRLRIVSRTRKNFSASMCVASFVGFAR